MNIEDFFKLLNQNTDKYLLFEYAPNLLIGANYHITEIKHITVESVDCGAQTDTWKETIIQLWEDPHELGKTEYMSVLKALNIFEKTQKMKAFQLNTKVKFEYGNATFHTAQLVVSNFKIQNNNLIIKLNFEKTDCKAKEACGITSAIETLSDDEPRCSPDGNCC